MAINVPGIPVALLRQRPVKSAAPELSLASGNVRPERGRGGVTSTTNARWRPFRAGILNVYQYEDEILHFAGGRLLLRGVNGSGKSTAMNMLLPFLLEADTRKIDAAGEQTAVPRSWMLADTDEIQRTGYLWIEFARTEQDAPGGVRHHTVGCGIRATDRGASLVVLDAKTAPHRLLVDRPADPPGHRRAARRAGHRRRLHHAR
jgi:hypothetical protein